MGSRGVGDVRRVMKDRRPQGWIDMNFTRPAPEVPVVRGDRLYDFVSHHLTKWEGQVAIEAREYQDGPHGAAFLRWALDVRRQCDAIRRVLVRYAETRDTGSPESISLRATLHDLSFAWEKAYDWREDWD